MVRMKTAYGRHILLTESTSSSFSATGDHSQALPSDKRTTAIRAGRG
jgi:hypothetical protein